MKTERGRAKSSFILAGMLQNRRGTPSVYFLEGTVYPPNEQNNQTIRHQIKI